MKTKSEILDLMEFENVKFSALWFTDIMGINKMLKFRQSIDKGASGKIPLTVRRL
jgi:glutamine synthetase